MSAKRFLLFLLCTAVLHTPRTARAELIYGLTGGPGTLVSFDSASPAIVNTIGNVTGASTGQFFYDINFRPSNGLLYGLAVNSFTGASNLYIINPLTAAASLVGNTPFTLSISIGGRVAMAFDPVTDLLRVISRNGANYRVNPNTGTIAAQDTTLTYLNGVPSQTPDSVAIAYSNNFPGATSSTLYSYTFNFDEFVRVGSAGGNPVSANSGICTVVGGSGTFPLSSNVGFDISRSGAAFMTANVGTSTLFSVNLANGHATQIGAIAGNLPIIAIAVAPIPEPSTTALAIAALLLLFGYLRGRRRAQQV
ncbi:MAG: DUF4394 domain-containing protein [Verrucomicrobiota bacterium]|nr:DUF4394 domain-containing protein [Verrucomicrobiota bacterium]